MNKKIKSYIVSSANWEIEVDEIHSSSAALSALIFAFKRYNKKLLLSTTIMVNEKNNHLNNNISDADFFATHKVLSDLGFDSMAESLLQITKRINETKNIKK